MLEKFTAPVSRLVDALVAEDGHDLSFETNRQSPDRSSGNFTSCTARMGIEGMEKGYQRINSWLRLRQIQSSRKTPRIVRTIAISSN